MAYDANFPPTGAGLVSAQWRAQFNGLFDIAQARAFEDDCVNRTLGSARNPGGVALLGLSVSNPPTQAEVQSVADKLDELIAILKRP